MLYHTVMRGDTLYGIARYYGVSVAAVMALNPGLNPYNLYAGQVIRIPAQGGRPRQEYPAPFFPRPPYLGGTGGAGAPGGAGMPGSPGSSGEPEGTGSPPQDVSPGGMAGSAGRGHGSYFVI